MGSRLVYSAPKWQVKNHKTIIKMISTNLLAIPALGEAFSVSSFWMNLILGRVAYYLQDRHVVYQMKALCMPNALLITFDHVGCRSSIGRRFLNIFFWVNLILGRLVYYLKYRHVAYQLVALVIMEHFANSFCSWRLPFQHWDRRPQCLLLYQHDSWKNHILPLYKHVVHQIEALDMTH